MNLIKTLKIHVVSEALSPITHMMGTSGNEAVISREPVLFNGKVRMVPVLSGNAIRHRLIREPGAQHLVESLGLRGKLNIDQANYLFNGGSLTESSTTDNLGRIANLQELFPLIRLLGGSLKNQIIGGSLHVLRGVLICEENRAVLTAQLPAEYLLPSEAMRSSEDFIGKTQYTRGDATKMTDSAQLIEDPDLADAKSNLMIYSGQSVIPGSVFYHGFVLKNVSPLEVGALLNALDGWEKAGATIGGTSRIGHGQLKTQLFFEGDEDFFGTTLDPVKMVTEYRAHVDASRDKAVEWLNQAFPSKSKGLL